MNLVMQLLVTGFLGFVLGVGIAWGQAFVRRRGMA